MNENYYSYTDDTKSNLAAFDNTAVSGNGMSISGGLKHTVYAGSFAPNGKQSNYGKRAVTGRRSGARRISVRPAQDHE